MVSHPHQLPCCKVESFINMELLQSTNGFILFLSLLSKASLGNVHKIQMICFFYNGVTKNHDVVKRLNWDPFTSFMGECPWEKKKEQVTH